MSQQRSASTVQRSVVARSSVRRSGSGSIQTTPDQTSNAPAQTSPAPGTADKMADGGRGRVERGTSGSVAPVGRPCAQGCKEVEQRACYLTQ